MTANIPNDESAGKLVKYLLEKGLGGFPPLSSAANLADEYLIDRDYDSNDERVAALIKWEMTKNFTTGFITGLGGIVALPVGVPSALVASWLIQARMAGAIARIYGHDLAEERVRTLILLSLAGDVAKQAMSDHYQANKALLPRAIVKQRDLIIELLMDGVSPESAFQQAARVLV